MPISPLWLSYLPLWKGRAVGLGEVKLSRSKRDCEPLLSSGRQLLTCLFTPAMLLLCGKDLPDRGFVEIASPMGPICYWNQWERYREKSVILQSPRRANGLIRQTGLLLGTDLSPKLVSSLINLHLRQPLGTRNSARQQVVAGTPIGNLDWIPDAQLCPYPPFPP